MHRYSTILYHSCRTILDKFIFNFDTDTSPSLFLQGADWNRIGDFENGLNSYFDKDFEQAMIHFRKVLSKNPSDLAAQIYYKNSAYDLKNGAYFFLIEGEVLIENENLKKRDAIGIIEKNKVNIKANKSSKLLVIDVPMI